jgi:hypothetical protein
MSAQREHRPLSAGMPLIEVVQRPILSGNGQDEHEKRTCMSRLWHLIVASLVVVRVGFILP